MTEAELKTLTHTPAMVAPLLSINGTSASALMQQQFDVCENASNLLNALREAAPHPRDYQGFPARYAVAREVHEAHCRVVNELTKFYVDLAHEIAVAKEGG